MKKVVVGIDVSKKKLDVSVIADAESFGNPVYCGEFPNTKGGCTKIVSAVKKLAKGVPQEDWLLCVETTGGYSRCVCDTMYGKGLCIWRENALQIKWSNGVVREKSDKVDSVKIAEYAMRNQDRCVPYVPESTSVRSLKVLYSYRGGLVRERGRKMAQMKELKDNMPCGEERSYICKDLTRAIISLTKSIKECEERIKEAIECDKALKNNYTHITSIKGVGMVTAVAILIFSNNFQSSKDARKFSCYCGVAPFRAQSGSSVHHRKDVRHLSNRHVKALLTSSALIAIRYNRDIQEYYQRLINAGKCHGVAINNVRSKLLRIAFSLVEHDCDYEENHEEKRKKLLDAEENL